MCTLSVTKIFTFDAAHKLPMYDGDCANLHGHQWTLEIEVSGPVISESGMIVDFKRLNKCVKDVIIDKMDHKYLNDVYENPTAENMTLGIVAELKPIIVAALKVMLVRVRLYETPTSYCEWKDSGSYYAHI